MDRITRIGLAIVAAAAILALVGWLDGTVLVHAQRVEGTTFEPGPLLWWHSVAYLVTAAGVLGVGLAGWWARSLAIGIVYLVGGAFFALLDIITWQLAASVNGAPPVLPQPVATAIGRLYSWQQGPIGSMRIVAQSGGP
jgi:hypothetical protein